MGPGSFQDLKGIDTEETNSGGVASAQRDQPGLPFSSYRRNACPGPTLNPTSFAAPQDPSAWIFLGNARSARGYKQAFAG